MKFKKHVTALRLFIVAIMLTPFFVMLFSPSFGWALLWTYWHSETGIGWWIGHGHSTSTAIAIGILLGGFSSFIGWLFINFDRDAIKVAKLAWDMGPADHTADKEHWKHRFPYWFLLAIFCVPMGVFWIGLVWAKLKSLNVWGSLVLLLIGGIAKNVLWGGTFAALGTQSAFFKENVVRLAAGIWIFVLLAIGKKLISKFFRKSPRIGLASLPMPLEAETKN